MTPNGRHCKVQFPSTESSEGCTKVMVANHKSNIAMVHVQHNCKEKRGNSWLKFASNRIKPHQKHTLKPIRDVEILLISDVLGIR